MVLACLMGEASPYYLSHPLASERIAQTCPNVRLIVLLRNPVARAYSHYWHQVRRGNEKLSFEQALDREDARLEGEVARVRANPEYCSLHLQRHSYQYRGRYALHLSDWFRYFSRGQMLVLRSKDYFSEPLSVLDRVLTFLGVRPLADVGGNRGHYIIHANRAPKVPPMLPETRARLADAFRPHNRALEAMLGYKMGWDA